MAARPPLAADPRFRRRRHQPAAASIGAPPGQVAVAEADAIVSSLEFAP
jgi:hypothetical protein